LSIITQTQASEHIDVGSGQRPDWSQFGPPSVTQVERNDWLSLATAVGIVSAGSR